MIILIFQFREERVLSSSIGEMEGRQLFLVDAETPDRINTEAVAFTE